MDTEKGFFEKYKGWIALAVVVAALEAVTRMWP
jgi:hypothetical protein